MSGTPDPQRLREAANLVERGWMPLTATRRIAGESQSVDIRHLDLQFRPLCALEAPGPDAHTVVEFDIALDLPDELHGVRLVGQPLELTMISSYPTQVLLDGKAVFEDELPIVASGPAAVTVLPCIRSGGSGLLTIRVRTGRSDVHGEMGRWMLAFQLTTPALTDRFRVLDIAAATAELGVALKNGRTPSDYTIWCIGHSHIDLSWLWDWADAREVVKRDLRTVTGLMRDYPEFRFTHSQPAGYQAVEEDDPALFAELLGLIEAGRLEPATMQWVESDTNTASGPAAARQLLEGVGYSRERLGVSPTVHLAPDTFGHAGNLPQLTSSAGATVYYHHRANPGTASGGAMWPAYWWEGDNGSRILAISTPIYLGPLTAGRLVADLILAGIGQGRTDICYFYGVGDHGGGPTRHDLDFLRLIAAEDDLPTVRCSTVGEYRDALLESAESLPVHRGESMTVFEGCYVSHSDSKRANRDGENALVAAETLAAIAGIDTGDDLREAWREVLFNQFHDILGGSAVRTVYEDQQRSAVGVESVAARLRSRALDVLEAGVGSEGCWVVTNPVGSTRFDVIELPVGDEIAGPVVVLDETGTSYAAQRTPAGCVVFLTALAAFETKSFSISPADGDPLPMVVKVLDVDLFDGLRYFVIDTEHFLVHLRTDSGIITTLYAKHFGKEFVGHGEARGRSAEQSRPDLGLGVLQLLDEQPHMMTAWVVDEVFREESLLRGGSTTIVEQGAVRTVFESRHAVRSSHVIVRTLLYAALGRIDYELEIDWQEVGSATDGVPSLAISFTTRQGGVEAWYETPFAAASRPADGRLVPALRWADIGDGSTGLAVVNSGRYGHEALGSRMRIHLARGSYDPDALGDLGTERVLFRLVPHAGSWRSNRIVEEAAALNAPLLIRRRMADAGAQSRAVWRPWVSGSGVVIAEVKAEVHGVGRIIRLYESAGLDRTVSLGRVPEGSGVWECSVIEERGRRLPTPSDGLIRLTFSPFEVKTLCVEALAS